jgi:hypothetical protein
MAKVATGGRRRGGIVGWYSRRARFLFIERGLRGGDRFWLIMGGLFVGTRLVKRTIGRVEETLTLDTLKPGQSMTISVMAPPKRAARRAAKRSAGA